VKPKSRGSNASEDTPFKETANVLLFMNSKIWSEKRGGTPEGGRVGTKASGSKCTHRKKCCCVRCTGINQKREAESWKTSKNCLSLRKENGGRKRGNPGGPRGEPGRLGERGKGKGLAQTRGLRGTPLPGDGKRRRRDDRNRAQWIKGILQGGGPDGNHGGICGAGAETTVASNRRVKSLQRHSKRRGNLGNPWSESTQP